MRHHNRNKKLGRERNQRGALMRTMAVALIERGSITTTEAKAKVLRPFVERLVTTAKPGNLSARRLLASRLDNNQKIVKKLMEEISVAHKTRAGGYLRIVKLPARKSDGSKMAQISFV